PPSPPPPEPDPQPPPTPTPTPQPQPLPLPVEPPTAPTGADGRVRLFAVGAGAGAGPQVRVFNADGSPRFEFLAYDAGFTGGVRVATGDVNGDAVDDIVTAAGPGGGAHVKVFSGRDGSLLKSFFAYDPQFRGGVFVAAADFTGDGMADIVTGAGA